MKSLAFISAILLSLNGLASSIIINRDTFYLSNKLVDFYRIQKPDLEIPQLSKRYIEHGPWLDATYQLRNNKLFLIDFKVPSETGFGWTSVFDIMFPGDSIVEITCYHGIIQCWKGETIGFRKWSEYRFIEYSENGVTQMIDVPGSLVDQYLEAQLNIFRYSAYYKALMRKLRNEGMGYRERTEVVNKNNLFNYITKLYKLE